MDENNLKPDKEMTETQAKTKPEPSVKQKSMKIMMDLCFSIAGLVAMNGVIQLFLYPEIDKANPSEYGDILTLLAVISVLATTFGTGAGYARMVAKTKDRSNNGDFNLFLLGASLISVVVICIATFMIMGNKGIPYFILASVLTILNILRYYGDVEYKLNVNYFKFFIYYMFIAVGYGVGTVLIANKLPNASVSWIVAMMIGEAACIAYVTLSGSIFRGKDVIKKSEFFGDNMKCIMYLMLTNFINAFALQADKILLNAFAPDGKGSEYVAIFYVATLVGKIVALLTTPLNGIIVGYLAKYKGKIGYKFFGIATILAVIVGIIFIVGAWQASYIFVGWKYAERLATAEPYFLAASAGQVCYFISGSMMVVVLRFVHEKFQLVINAVYAVVFAAVVIPAVMFGGLWGITWGLLAVNLARFIAVVIFGFAAIYINNKREAGKIEEVSVEN